ncbi:hypothetical protein DL771_001423 [Monosporascus sp. 5C6A]|nr:hypothetical protein DL771_001423 [Monosporascus sp. 5C6A]
MGDNHAIVMSGPDKGKGLSCITGCLNGRLLYACGLIALSQVNFGMDQGAFNGIQAIDAFICKFSALNEWTGQYKLETYYLSLLNCLTYIGFVFGLVTGNYISRRWGRKRCMFIMCAWAIFGPIILLTPHTRQQMLAGQIVAYVYVGMELALVPVLQSELTPAPVRVWFQNLSSVYGTTFIKSVGTINPFTMNSANIAVNITMVLVTQLLTKITGPVPLMVAGAALQTPVPFTMGGLGTVTPQTTAVGTGIVAMLTVFGAGFQLGWAPLSHVVAAEIPTAGLRDATYALGSTSFRAFLFSLFCIPGCSGKTLEEIDELFVERVPIRKFGKTRPRNMPQLADGVKKGGKSVQVEQA